MRSARPSDATRHVGWAPLPEVVPAWPRKRAGNRAVAQRIAQALHHRCVAARGRSPSPSPSWAKTPTARTCAAARSATDDVPLRDELRFSRAPAWPCGTIWGVARTQC